MSEFDKEAEREKLREKFAKDEEKRQSTKRMSELLLKGATMTNSHCNQCGDPVFRFDGREFCPSCQDATVAGGQIQLRNPEGRQQGSESSQPAQTAQATQATQATGAGQSVESAEQGESTASEATAERTETGDAESTAQDTDVEPTQPPVPATDSVASAKPTESSGATTSQPSPTGNADLDAARASLRRTVTRYAEEAERTDDPRRARELLSAAHEAAETLAALRR